MPENNGVYKNIYIHHNFNRNEIREFLLQNANYENRPNPSPGTDRGLMYFDTDIGRIIVWDGENWKIVKYFDDRDIESNDNLKLQDIWAESNIVSNLSEEEAKGLTGSQSVVQYWENRSTIYVPGTLSFNVPDMEAVIFPKTFVEGTGASYSEFYEPVVKNHLGSTISPGCYRISEYTTRTSNNIKYRIEFFDSKKMNLLQVNSDNLPTVTFFKYVGERLSLTAINGLTNKFLLFGSDFTPTLSNSNILRRNLTGTGVTKLGNISSLSVNGQELAPEEHYDIVEISSIYYLQIDVSENGTDWVDEGGLSSDDFIYLNVSTAF